MKFGVKYTKYICGVISAAMLIVSSGSIAFADGANKSADNISNSAEGSIRAEAPSASPEPSAVPSAEPLPSASPQNITMSMPVTATYYTTDTKNQYRVTFKTDDTLPQIKAFEFTATIDDGTIESTEIGNSFSSNGTVSKSITDDKSVKFVWKDGDAVSGSVILSSLIINTNQIPSDKNVNIDSFTAVCSDGSRLTINSKANIVKGTNMPELSEKAQTAYDMLMELPTKDMLTFYDSDKESLCNLVIKYSDPIEAAIKKYDALTPVDKKNVDTALSISNNSVESIKDVLNSVKAMQSVFGIMEIAGCFENLSDDASAINYLFLTKTYDNISTSVPGALSQAPTAAEEYKSVLAQIDEYNKIVSKNINLLNEKTYENYQTKIGALKAQFEMAKKLNQLTYSKAFISAVSMLADELYEDIDKNYTASYKDYMLKDINEIRDEIENGSEIYDSLPTFSAPPDFIIGRSVTVTFERRNTLSDQAAEAAIYTYDENGKLIQEDSEKFESGRTKTAVNFSTSSSLYKSSKRYILKCYYIYNGISYYLGSSGLTAYPQRIQNTGGSTGGGGNTGGGNTGGGNTYPTVTPNNPPSETKAPNMANDNPYSDIDNYGWALESIIGLTNAGIVNGMGDNEFNPAGNVTREQFCKMVVQLFGVSVNDTDTDFSDVDPDAWYAPYITAAVQAGYVQGQSDDYFGVGESIMRQDMATILYRAANKTGDGVILDFTDEASIAQYARDAVSELVGLDIMNGYEDGSFKPRGSATRAEAAKVIWGIYQIL